MVANKGNQMNGSNTYAERNSQPNIGELLFEEHCLENKFFCARLGFDEKNAKIPRFFDLNSCIKNLPDYYICNDKKSWLVMVKGTANIKQSEFNLIPQLIDWYSDKNSPLFYAFCFVNQKPIFIPAKKVIELYNIETDRQWSDGKIYRKLAL